MSKLSSVRSWLWIVIIAGLILLAFMLRTWMSQMVTHKETVQADVLLNSVEKVMKLIAVEGYFSEIYDYKDYYFSDFMPFRKKALVRVKAKVSMGYNLNRINIRSDQATHTIHIGPLPEVEILSIDHDLDYYDVTEGVFNYFTEEDFSKLSANAKELIRTKAQKSQLKAQAEAQSAEMLEMLDLLIHNSGWKLIIDGDHNPLRK